MNIFVRALGEAIKAWFLALSLYSGMKLAFYLLLIWLSKQEDDDADKSE